MNTVLLIAIILAVCKTINTVGPPNKNRGTKTPNKTKSYSSIYPRVDRFLFLNNSYMIYIRTNATKGERVPFLPNYSPVVICYGFGQQSNYINATVDVTLLGFHLSPNYGYNSLLFDVVVTDRLKELIAIANHTEFRTHVIASCNKKLIKVDLTAVFVSDDWTPQQLNETVSVNNKSLEIVRNVSTDPSKIYDTSTKIPYSSADNGDNRTSSDISNVSNSTTDNGANRTYLDIPYNVTNNTNNFTLPLEAPSYNYCNRTINITSNVTAIPVQNSNTSLSTTLWAAWILLLIFIGAACVRQWCGCCKNPQGGCLPRLGETMGNY